MAFHVRLLTVSLTTLGSCVLSSQEKDADPNAVVECWEQGHTRESCCSTAGTPIQAAARSAACFDSIYTPEECCGKGWARLFPTALSEIPVWQDGFAWAQQGEHTRHPAHSLAQRRWEAQMRNSSIMMEEEILGHELKYIAFKRSGPALAAVMNELREDLYRLKHITPPKNMKAPVVVDIGASIGLVSVLICKLWENARVIALEPAPSNFRYLLWNLKENGVENCVFPLNIAAGATPLTSQSFFYSPTYPTWSQICDRDDCKEQNDETWRGGWTDWQIRFEAETTTLAEVMSSLHLGDIHFLKVDCEGCEWSVFAPHVWDRVRHRVRNVATELHDWALPKDAAEGLREAVRRTVCKHEEVRENSLCSTS
eukprot:TRINITY_DN26131_c0_g1_i1.p1 TRINITY_DN26131_c0_g1~~TRINITY_DN26131_c0_g1_i1.p1  ORF type:complete len:369 (+),score=59.13 TRINITY_DN26131_c0_g1_i1:117-1223(+)